MFQTVYFEPLRVFRNGQTGRRGERRDQVDAPRIDVVESSGYYQLFIELPGVPVDAIDVTEENGVLTIVAERKRRVVGDEETLTRTEIEPVRYQRRFTLPEDADRDAINAESRDGVLRLEIGRRRPQVNQRKIKVTD